MSICSVQKDSLLRLCCRWSAYGGYQRALWYQLDRRRGFNPEDPPKHEGSEVVRVQALAALLGGCTSAFLTNPLDVVKTRLQVDHFIQDLKNL